MKNIIFFIFSLFFLINLYAQDCPPGMYRVKEHYRSGYIRSDGKVFSPTTVSEHCKNYRSEGTTEINFERGLAKGWVNKQEKATECPPSKQKEIEKIIQKLSGPMKDLGLVRFFCAKVFLDEDGNSSDNPGASSVARKAITIYDSVEKYGLENVVIHELAHLLYAQLSQKEKDSYAMVAGWEENERTKELILKRRKILRDHEELDSNEDFTINAEFFLTNKEYFKKELPEMNHWFESLWGEKHEERSIFSRMYQSFLNFMRGIQWKK